MDVEKKSSKIRLDYIRTDLYFVFQRDEKSENNLRNMLQTTNMYKKAMYDNISI